VIRGTFDDRGASRLDVIASDHVSSESGVCKSYQIQLPSLLHFVDGDFQFHRARGGRAWLGLAVGADEPHRGPLSTGDFMRIEERQRSVGKTGNELIPSWCGGGSFTSPFTRLTVNIVIAGARRGGGPSSRACRGNCRRRRWTARIRGGGGGTVLVAGRRGRDRGCSAACVIEPGREGLVGIDGDHGTAGRKFREFACLLGHRGRARRPRCPGCRKSRRSAPV